MKHWASKRIFGTALSFAIVAAGCMGGGDGQAERAYLGISTRVDTHHAAAIGANDAGGLLTETEAYAREMPGLMDDMMGMCAGMMGSGMMDGRGMDRLDGMTTRMQTAVDEHRARLMGMTELPAMRAECDAHHAAMVGMLDEMRGMMIDGDMM